MSDGTLSFDTKIDSSGFSQGASELKSLATKAIAGIGIAISGKAIADTIIRLCSGVIWVFPCPIAV